MEVSCQSCAFADRRPPGLLAPRGQLVDERPYPRACVLGGAIALSPWDAARFEPSRGPMGRGPKLADRRDPGKGDGGDQERTRDQAKIAEWRVSPQPGRRIGRRQRPRTD